WGLTPELPARAELDSTPHAPCAFRSPLRTRLRASATAAATAGGLTPASHENRDDPSAPRQRKGLAVRGWRWRGRRPLVGCPGGEQAAEVGDELLVLVRRERRDDRLDEQRVELRALDVLDDELLEVRQLLGAERAVLVDLEVRVRESPVLPQLVLVRHVLAVARLEVVPRVLVDPHGARADRAERRPAD